MGEDDLPSVSGDWDCHRPGRPVERDEAVAAGAAYLERQASHGNRTGFNIRPGWQHIGSGVVGLRQVKRLVRVHKFSSRSRHITVRMRPILAQWPRIRKGVPTGRGPATPGYRPSPVRRCGGGSGLGSEGDGCGRMMAGRFFASLRMTTGAVRMTVGVVWADGGMGLAVGAVMGSGCGPAGPLDTGLRR